jgi:hypothetical protein
MWRQSRALMKDQVKLVGHYSISAARVRPPPFKYHVIFHQQRRGYSRGEEYTGLTVQF